MSRTPEQQKALNDAIVLAVSNEDDTMLRLGLEKGGSPDLYITEASNKGTLAQQQEDMLILALKKGADANVLLFTAMERRSPAVVKIAVEHGGADVNGTHASAGKTDAYPIAEWSYRNFSNDISEYLLAKGMDVDMPSKDGTTSLLRAVKDKDYAKTMHYLRHGANPFAANVKGEFPLRGAQDVTYQYGLEFYEKKSEVVRKMLENVPPDAEGPSGPGATFNTVATANDVSVNHPIELKKSSERPGDKPAKGFSL